MAEDMQAILDDLDRSGRQMLWHILCKSTRPLDVSLLPDPVRLRLEEHRKRQDRLSELLRRFPEQQAE